MTFPTAPSVPVPHLDVVADLGNFVYAVSKMPPGKSYMAAGSNCSWTGYMKLWSEVNLTPAHYRQITLEDLIDKLDDKEFGRELGYMFAYSTEPGYDGGDRQLLWAEDIRNVSFESLWTAAVMHY